MAEKTWDELCEEFDEALSMQEYVVPKSLMDRWNKVKAEGDKLGEAIKTYAEALIDAAKNKTEVNVSAVVVAKALLNIVEPKGK